MTTLNELLQFELAMHDKDIFFKDSMLEVVITDWSNEQDIVTMFTLPYTFHKIRAVNLVLLKDLTLAWCGTCLYKSGDCRLFLPITHLDEENVRTVKVESCTIKEYRHELATTRDLLRSLNGFRAQGADSSASRG